MRHDSDAANRAQTHRRCAAVPFVLLALAAFLSLSASALTVRAKSDLRLWETVTDRSTPLSWTWKDSADSARLSFSNRLTRTVSSLVVNRASGDVRGCCSHPVSPNTDEALVVATLIQCADGVEISRETTELAYAPGAAGRTLTVRTKGDRSWDHVEIPRLAAFDASWWNVNGPSGYEVMWARPVGYHRVVRAFEGVGEVDEATIFFGRPGFNLILR